jgi:carbamoyltransferase
MIMTFDTYPDKREHMRAAIHPYDSTARPQEVYKEWNEDYWKLINYFEEFTGESVILNTSFNLHGYPVVYTPEDAIFVFENSGLNYLALGNFLLKKIDK